MKALILCCDYPPLNSIGAQRPASWRRYLPEYGVDVHVIASARGGVASPNRKVDPEVERVELPPVLPERMIDRHGMHRFVLPRKALSLLYRTFSFSWPRFDKHRGLFEAAARWLTDHRADVIVATGEPFILFRHAARLSRRFDVPWIADYRDGWFHNHVTRRDRRRGARLARWHECRIERRTLESCSLISTVDSHLAGRLGEMHGKPTAVVRNGFDELYEGPADRAGADDRTLLISHVGTLTPGQRIEFTLDAVRRLVETRGITPDDLRLRFVGLASSEVQCRRVREGAGDLEPFLEFTERVPRPEALAMSAGSDLLLAPTEPDYTAVFAKAFDYLATGRPILVAPGDGALLDAFVRECGAGRSFETVDDLTDFLWRAVEERRSGRAPDSAPDAAAVTKYTRRRQAEVMARALRHVKQR
ncbi:MAG: glycosyltransferase [Planctomycetota bacterium]